MQFMEDNSAGRTLLAGGGVANDGYAILVPRSRAHRLTVPAVRGFRVEPSFRSMADRSRRRDCPQVCAVVVRGDVLTVVG